MTITLIPQETYDRLMEIYTQYPNLSLQNKGYQYINKSKLTAEELEVFSEVQTILSKHINDFREFNNFKISKRGEIQLRFQYIWDPNDTRFRGVGYILLSELLNGFEDKALINT